MTVVAKARPLPPTIAPRRGEPLDKQPPAPPARPTIVVVAEHLRAGHSVFRTHSRAVIGVFRRDLVDEAARRCSTRPSLFPPASSCRRPATLRSRSRRAPALVLHIGVGIPPRVPVEGGVVRIAIAASLPGLNPALFQILARIEATAARPVELHFVTLGAVGLARRDVARIARLRLK